MVLTEFGSAMTLVTGLFAYGVYVKSKRQSLYDISKSLNNTDYTEKENLNNNEHFMNKGGSSIFDNNNQIKRRLFD